METLRTPQNTTAIINTKDAAKCFGVSTVTMRTWIKEGKIPAYRVGKHYRINKKDLFIKVEPKAA